MRITFEPRPWAGSLDPGRGARRGHLTAAGMSDDHDLWLFIMNAATTERLMGVVRLSPRARSHFR